MPESRVTRNQDLYRNNNNNKNDLPLWKKILKYVFWTFFGLFCLGLLLFIFYAHSAPKITQSELASQNATKIYDNNGHLIIDLSNQNRSYVKGKQIPDMLKQSVVSIEDRRFYKHHFGIDPVRIVEAAFADLTGSSLGLQGGSTLTQQLVKLSVFSTNASDQTLKRKAQEAYLAYKVERKYSKNQILTYYINKVYMGNGVYGMGTAAKYYYSKPLTKLNYIQLATLAGMPQSPTNYDPTAHPTYAKERRNNVLQAMYKNDAISKSQLSKGLSTPIDDGIKVDHKIVDNHNRSLKYSSSYIQEVLKELQQHGYNPYKNHVKVYTYLNSSAQKRLYNIVNNDYVGFPGPACQVGVTMTDPNNGAVTAMIGGRNEKGLFDLNRAVQTNRSSGSSIKPFMDYGPAIQYLEWPTFKPLQDTPYTYPGTHTKLNNWDHKYQGTITMRKALVESRNIPAIRTLASVGLNRATQFMAANGMTFKKPLVYSNGIGAPVSTEQEAAAYGALANGGIYHEPHLIKKITMESGDSKQFKYKSHRSMSSATAYMLTDILKGVPSSQWAPAAAIPGLYQAGKTGQSSYPSYSGVPNDAVMDSWYTGYTRNNVISVWTGYDQPMEPGHYLSEMSHLPQNIYRLLQTYMASRQVNENWTMPDSVEEVGYHGSHELAIRGSDWERWMSTSAKTQSSPTGSETNNVSSNSNNESNNNNDNDNTGQSNNQTTQQPSGGNGNGNGNNGMNNNNNAGQNAANAVNNVLRSIIQ